jgi:hypothetical protein
MNFLRTVFGIPKNETSVKPPLTKKEVDDAVNDFLKDGNPNPSNKEIAEKLGRTIVEVNVFRRYVPSVFHTYYDSDSDSDGEEMIGKSTSTQGGRKNNKTISNKNKKKHKKLSRRRSNKKNKKSMKRK